MDLALRNGTIIDGTGRARYRGDVGIKNGRIVAVGEVKGKASEEVDVAGAVIAPGFFTNMSQTLGPLPSSRVAPSI